MRDNHAAFVEANTAVVAVTKDDVEDVMEYCSENEIPFYCVPDPEATIGASYYQRSKLGLMPAIFVIDQSMVIRYVHYGTGMADIPTAAELLEIAKSSR